MDEVADIEEDLTAPANEQGAPRRQRNYYGIGSVCFPPENTACKFEYKGKTYSGIILNGSLVVEGYGVYRSFSRASVELTGTIRNGWRDWWIQPDDTGKWITADDWRRKQRRT